MSNVPAREPAHDQGLWLGIAPLAVGADTLLSGLALATVSAVVLLGTSLVAAGARQVIPAPARLAGLFLVSGALAVILRLAGEALVFDLALGLGGLLALATTHAAVVAAADATGGDGALGGAARLAVSGAATLLAIGALRGWIGGGNPPAGTFFFLAALAAAVQALRGRRAGLP